MPWNPERRRLWTLVTVTKKNVGNISIIGVIGPWAELVDSGIFHSHGKCLLPFECRGRYHIDESISDLPKRLCRFVYTFSWTSRQQVILDSDLQKWTQTKGGAYGEARCLRSNEGCVGRIECRMREHIPILGGLYDILCKALAFRIMWYRRNDLTSLIVWDGNVYKI